MPKSIQRLRNHLPQCPCGKGQLTTGYAKQNNRWERMKDVAYCLVCKEAWHVDFSKLKELN